jgi:hypothetical protein
MIKVRKSLTCLSSHVLSNQPKKRVVASCPTKDPCF